MNIKETEAFKSLSTLRFWKEILIISIAMFIAAAAVYYFLIPSKLVVGSISGLSIVVAGVLAKMGIVVKVSQIVLIINAILIIIAYLLLGSDFGLKTTYAALILGPMMNVWERICPYEQLMEPGASSMIGNLWFDLLCFVLVLSASQAILFRINASTGGLDIIAKILNKYFHFDMGMSVTIAGVCICCTAFLINPFRLVIIGLIGTWVNGIVINYFMSTLNLRKRVCIISKDSERIRAHIIDDIVRGCTLYEVKGGYTGEKYTEIQTLLTQAEFADLMQFIRDNDIKAFITAGNVSEVYGLWSDKKTRRKVKGK